MKETNFFEQYSQAVEMAECRIADFEEFNKIYSFEDREYFMSKLTEMGYDENEVLSILMNKDLMLALFMNSFETMVLESDVVTEIDIDLDIEKARKDYIDAVDRANQSIEAANESYKIMNALKLLIESKYGYNSNDWGEDSVHEMNEAIKVYNRLVEQANKDVQESNEARQELAKVRSKNKEVNIINNDVVLEAS
ncbi:MAG: hypothetical protein E7171_03215 [Firmicutes bacterium]|nr:hypothetical protein [Bacillota bacterium]